MATPRAAAGLDQALVVRLAAAGVGPVARRPQVVVARRPDDPREARRVTSSTNSSCASVSPVSPATISQSSGRAGSASTARRLASKPTCRSLMAQTVTAASAAGRHVSQGHRQVGAVALDGQCQPVRRGRPRLPELPARRVVVEPGGEANRRRRPGAQGERELVERQRQAQPAGLDVRLLQRPVVEEHPRLLGGGQRAQVAHLVGREVALGHALEHWPGHGFHVHAHAVAARHRQRDESVRCARR